MKRHEGREVNLKAWVNIDTPRTTWRHLHKRVADSALGREKKTSFHICLKQLPITAQL